MTSPSPLIPRRHGASRSGFPALACGQRARHTRRYVSTVIAWIHFSDAPGMQRLRSRAQLASRCRCLGSTDLARIGHV
jgi:hypothetical protein